ncbi:glycosyltransferase family 9 protein [Aliagarivorans marinus]|uniref:glycosyltransferase family 9 protein n=1 Tax=Aliagarivorans marinus TaxID=561965 RepID=UPI00047D80DE|nr:glycosyltransferase family 9 protein [Aliagarivorans marinus]
MNNTASPNTICVLRLSAIGDVCNALAAVQQIQQGFPKAKITWVCGKAEARLLAIFDDIEVVVFDKSQGWRGLIALRKQLAGRRFDVLLHMQAALRASLCSLMISAKRRIGFDRARAKDGQWLFTSEAIQIASTPHVLDGFMQFVAQLGLTPQPPSWHVPLSEQAVTWAKQTLGEGKHLLICPAASKDYKNWTLDGYQQLAEYALEQGFRVSLIGSPSAKEKALSAKLSQRCQGQLNDLCGHTSLEQLWALIQRADLLLSPDTGPAHMAVAVGTPVLGVYAHHNPKRTGPYYSQEYVVSVWQQLIEAQHQRPADQLSWRSRVKDPKAMQAIEADQVIAMFQRIQREHQL